MVDGNMKTENFKLGKNMTVFYTKFTIYNLL